MTLLLDGGEDDDGNDLGPQKIWIYDPNQKPITESGRTQELDQSNGHGDTTGTDSGERINGLPRIEELDDAVVNADSTLTSSDEATLVEDFEDKCQLTSPSEDSSSVNLTTSPSVADVKNGDGGVGNHGENAVIEEQEQKKPTEVGSTRKRKGRDDSPVRKDSAPAEEEEAGSDDELVFICE